MELFWHQAPLVRILIPFLSGILFRLSLDGFEISQGLIFTVLVILILVIILLEKQWKNYLNNHYFGILVSLAFFLLGVYTLNGKSFPGNDEPFEGEYHRALILTAPAEKSKTYAVLLDLISDTSLNAHTSTKILAYISKDNFSEEVAPGSIIQFTGRVSHHKPPRHPHQFDYGQYLRRKGISGTVYLPKKHYTVENRVSHNSLTLFRSLRSELLKTLEKKVPDREEHGILAALLLGDRSFLDPELRNEFADAGAVHILAVSGLHVGIIYLFVLSILKLILPKRRALSFFLILTILWIYAGITGFSPSVLRASTMFSFIALGKLSGKFGNIYNMIAASALVLLLVDPFLITQVGFQLSYLAVTGIVFFFPKLHGIWIVENKWMDKFWSLVCVSVAAQLATFPLSLYYFNQFPNYFLLTNMIAIPMATAILYSGLLWIIFLKVPFLSDLIGFFVVKFTWLLNQGVSFISALPHSKTENVYLSGFEVILLYSLIIAVSVFFLHPRKRSLRLAGAISVLVAISIEFRSIRNHLNEEIYFPNLRDNPTAIVLRGKEAKVLTSDTSAIVEFLTRDLRPYLLSRGVQPDKIAVEKMNSGSSVKSDYTTVNNKAIRGGAHLIWHTKGAEKLVFRRYEKLEEMPLSTSPSISPLKIRELSSFSIDPPLLQKSDYR